MMLVEIEGTTYKVSWKHLTDDETGNRSTHCEINKVVDINVRPYELELVDKGIAFCHPNDPFVKAMGRKYSLKKALNKWNIYNMTLPQDRKLTGIYEFKQEIKKQRAAFWKAYLAEFPIIKTKR